jgi:hypothetical protein
MQRRRPRPALYFKRSLHATPVLSRRREPPCSVGVPPDGRERGARWRNLQASGGVQGLRVVHAYHQTWFDSEHSGAWGEGTAPSVNQPKSGVSIYSPRSMRDVAGPRSGLWVAHVRISRLNSACVNASTTPFSRAN